MSTKIGRIVLAEDNANDVELTLTALEDCHLANEVVVVHDGVELLDYLHHRGVYVSRSDGQPAVILLDIKMPRMDGIEALKAIKSDSALKLIPVVMLTSSREENDLVETYQLGANAYVVKPVDFQQFIEAVRNVGLFWAVINEAPAGSANE